MSRDGLRGALWRDLPLVYLWFSPLALLNLEVAQLGLPAGPAILAFLPPFLVACAALRRAPHLRPRLGLLAAVSSCAVALILLGWTGPAPSRDAMLWMTEGLALAAFLLLALHAVLAAGPGVAAALFGVGLAYGAVLESGGVLLGFFTEEAFRIRLGGMPAPFATIVGWCLVFYPLWAAVPRLAGEAASTARCAGLATALALLQDLQLDPAATAAGFWVWHPSLPPAVRGVPAVNFCAWFAAVLPFAWVSFAARRGEGIDAGRVARRLPAILIAALGLVLLAASIVEAPIGWPSLARFAAALGGAGTAPVSPPPP